MQNSTLENEIRFDNSIVVTLTDDKLTARDDSGWNSFIPRDDLGAFSYQITYLRRKDPLFVGVILILLGIIAFVVIKDVALSLIIPGVLFAIALLIFAVVILATFTGSTIYEEFLDRFNSDRMFFVRIRGKGGTEVSFYTSDKEEEKIIQLFYYR